MRRPLRQLKELASQHEVPVVCAGDVFHTWKSVPQLINFAIAELPEMYAVPGNHDLPYHKYDDIAKSAYWTLVEAGTIHNLPPGEPWCPRSNKHPLYIYGYPCGFMPDKAHRDKDRKGFHLAVVHHYCWNKGHSFPDAPEDCHVGKMRQRLRGFDAAVFGDNHSGFLDNSARPWIFNCGALTRRNSDQHDYAPRVGLLYSDGTIKQQFLNVEEDKLIRTAGRLHPADIVDALPFVEMLQEISVNDLDFLEAIQQYVKRHKNKLPIQVKRILEQIIESVK